VDLVEQVVEIALEHRLELVHGDARAVIGDPALRKVVGADLLAAPARADLLPPLVRALARGAFLLRLEQSARAAPSSPCSCS
jgi:hypothetical protein